MTFLTGFEASLVNAQWKPRSRAQTLGPTQQQQHGWTQTHSQTLVLYTNYILFLSPNSQTPLERRKIKAHLLRKEQ